MVSASPLLAKEGWPRHQENVAKPLLMERTGWSFTRQVATIDSETWLVSDHPVCAASVATRLFLTGAAVPSFARRGLRPLEILRRFIHTVFDRGYTLERTQECDQIRLFLWCKVDSKSLVVEFDNIEQRRR